jgi:hypothetical protein
MEALLKIKIAALTGTGHSTILFVNLFAVHSALDGLSNHWQAC